MGHEVKTERGGFEPPVRFDPHTAFPVPHNRPLCHLSRGLSAGQPHDTLAPYPRQFGEARARIDWPSGLHLRSERDSVAAQAPVAIGGDEIVVLDSDAADSR